MKNLIQYAAALYAFGVTLAYDTKTGELDVVSYPDASSGFSVEGAKEIVDAAIEDIQKFENTSNFEDGKAVIALADLVDGKTNPVTKTARRNILEEIGWLRDGKFIRQVLERNKVNRSWHNSEEPRICTYFGEICTNRGIEDTSHRRGRKSERRPQDYHVQSTRGIAREQLVTPAVERLYDNIPSSRLVADNKPKVVFNIQDIRDMDPEDLQKLIERVKELNVTR